MLHRQLLTALWAGAFVFLAPAAPAVVINEIHYNPEEGSELEFIELYNPAASPVDLSGWAFIEGVRQRLPEGTTIAPDGYLVVCRNPEALAAAFDLRVEDLIWWSSSNLDNRGEKIVLVDDLEHLVEEVAYGDRPPWDPDADGDGPSLERLCAHARSNHWTSWVATRGLEPTPLAPNHESECPPPAAPAPAVAINEVYYHPLNDLDLEHEYVELVNTTGESIDLTSYHFSDGIDFTFPAGTTLGAGEFLVVCRDEEAVRKDFGIQNTIGNFTAQLSNSGERLTLLDARNRVADSVRYEDEGDWSGGADGFGFSLEKIHPRADSDDPRSWMDSGAVDREVVSGWKTVVLEGVATSDDLLFYIGDEGEFLIDDVSLVNTADPDTNLIANGTFDEGISGWEAQGSHRESRWSKSPDGPQFEEAALHLVATGRGSSRSSVRTETVTRLDLSPDVTYRLTFRYFHVSGDDGLVARLSISTPSRGIYLALGSDSGPVISPGEPNIVFRERVPPFVSHVKRFPEQPTSGDSTWISLRARGGANRVILNANLSDGPRELEMRDDGASRDGAAGDGTYGVEFPAQSHNTPVTFQIHVFSDEGDRVFPLRTDPQQFYGYYVNDNQPDSKLPVYTLILPSANARGYVASLNCQAYRPISFAHRGDLYTDVGLRRRGGSVCGDPDVIKKYLKVRFHKGHEFRLWPGYEFEAHKNINLQSLWTDKSLIREHMAFEVFGEMGQPTCTHDYVRLHANGEYFGLYAVLERPDERYLERNGVSSEGNLYKATASREERNGTTGNLMTSYEKKTNENGDFSDLAEFLDALHTTRRTELVDFFQQTIDEDNLIEYQASQALINNRDYGHKNHYLYNDIERGRWMVLPWDVDLAYGKRWDGNFEGVLNDRMDNPGTTPWHTTSVLGSGGGNYLHDKFFSQSGTWYRRAYLVRLWDALHERYTPEIYEEKILALRELLLEEQAEDIAEWGRSRPSANDRGAPAEFDPNLDRVREHIRIRWDYLIDYIRTRHDFDGSHARLKITEIMYNPLQGEDAEFLEIWNNTGRDIDISGWTIEGLGTVEPDGSGEPFEFPEGSIIADGEIFIVAKDPRVFEAFYGRVARVFGPYPGALSNDGEELRVKDAGPEYPATVDFVWYRTDRGWPPEPDGLGFSLELTGVAPYRDNDLPANWRASEARGGSPGEVEGLTTPEPEEVTFRRGDANSDGNVDQTDAIVVLSYLFQSEITLSCEQSADTNGDDSVNLSDGIYLLRHLFAGGEAPPPPFAECGPPVPGELGCEAFSGCER